MHTYTYIFVYIHICIYTNVCIYIYIDTHGYIYIYIYTLCCGEDMGDVWREGDAVSTMPDVAPPSTPPTCMLDDTLGCGSVCVPSICWAVALICKCVCGRCCTCGCRWCAAFGAMCCDGCLVFVCPRSARPGALLQMSPHDSSWLPTYPSVGAWVTACERRKSAVPVRAHGLPRDMPRDMP